MALLDQLNRKIKKKTFSNAKEEGAVSLIQRSVPQAHVVDGQIERTALRITLPPYSPKLSPSDYWLFSDLKGMLQEKKFCSNEGTIAFEAYFESKD
ncbi:hypothetical protein TNCV_3445651 [Trichonephila clavipes]|nr:hypothetical protein TNCV_3445651 [Trichonephila clavipes]